VKRAALNALKLLNFINMKEQEVILKLIELCLAVATGECTYSQEQIDNIYLALVDQLNQIQSLESAR
jgi:hypothetical protein